ncbi:MAG: DNA ligase D [Myxococcaceae bacterium]|nr:DNA ligase D [Myxococcaceae bacterium]
MTLQLCEARDAAFTDPAWLWELKLDGFRLLVEKVGDEVALLLRRGRDVADQFPEIVAGVQALPAQALLLDGELVIPDAQGRPEFSELGKRAQAQGPAIERLKRERPAVFFAFDLLRHEADDLRGLALRERKERLKAALAGGERVRPVDHVEGQGEALLDLVRAQGLEGVVGKRADSTYVGGRVASWVKVGLTRTDDFAVVGHAPDFGSLQLATFDGQRYRYAGAVGSGFGPKQQKQARPVLERGRQPSPTCEGPFPPGLEVVWTTPTLVAEVRSKQWLPGGAPRHPVLMRLRDDKAPTECRDPRATAERPALPPPQVVLSNPRKVFWPDDGLTKQDLFDYYRAVSPWLLPYLKDRPLMLTRYPDGIRGKSFFQKQVPLRSPGWLRTVRVEGETGEIDQPVGGELRTLEWLANLAAIPIHLPSHRVTSPDRADWCVIDLDPKSAPFAHVVTLALALRELCEALALPTFPKLTGSSGLHVLVPLGAQADHGFAVHLAEALAAILVARHPAIATVERVVEKRGGKVYVDCYQNGAGKLIAAPLCVRPLPGAPVSMPLPWSEVTQALTPRRHGIRDAIAHLERHGDPMAPLLTTAPDLPRALEALARLASGR